MRIRKLGISVSVAVVLVLGAQGVRAQGLPGEISARTAADAQLQTNIDAEAAARAAADAALGATDAQLQTQIDQLRNSSGGTASVDCGSGGSINQALAAGAKTITVRGTCNESVAVNQDDVTLQADPAGGEIHGPDANANAVTVRGHRVTIDGLTVSGGRNGITGLGSTNLIIRNCTVQSTGRTGIVYINNAGGSVDSCQVHSNPRDGIAANGAHVTVVNSTISSNSRYGIVIAFGGSAQIGQNDRQEPAGNTITQNGSNGITVTTGGTAVIAMNQVSGNGTDAAQGTRSGIGIFQGSATLVGGNTISGNAGAGVNITGSTVTMGNGDVGITPVNTITGNGNSASPGGVSAFLGTSVVLRNVTIEGNNGPGVTLTTRSQAQLISSTIQGNLNLPLPGGFTSAGDGIRLVFGSALLPSNPGSTISGNAGAGIQCTDGESSVINTFPPTLTMSGNANGDLSASCTGF